MKYAIVRVGGHQYKVSEGEELLVDRLAKTDELSPEVLLYVNGDVVKVGKPTLKDVKVTVKRMDDEKGEKLGIFKYKAKSRYRRKIGFRSSLTRIRVEKMA